MGCGKTTLGMQWAIERGMQFVDLDELIENHTQQTVPELFQNKGETYFRALEKEILHQTSTFKNTIIACGGGTPCFHENMKWMKANGKTIYIRADEVSLFERLKKEKKQRPLISEMSEEALKSFIHTALLERAIFYEMAEEIFEF